MLRPINRSLYLKFTGLARPVAAKVECGFVQGQVAQTLLAKLVHA